MYIFEYAEDKGNLALQFFGISLKRNCLFWYYVCWNALADDT